MLRNYLAFRLISGFSFLRERWRAVFKSLILFSDRADFNISLVTIKKFVAFLLRLRIIYSGISKYQRAYLL